MPNREEQAQRRRDEESDRETREMVAFGVEAKNFLTSDLARYITDSAEEEVLAAKNALCVIDPEDVKGIRKQQNIIARYKSFDKWLSEIVAAGQTAYQVYLDQQLDVDE